MDLICTIFLDVGFCKKAKMSYRGLYSDGYEYIFQNVSSTLRQGLVMTFLVVG
jgi:hypothetical protein